MVATRLSPAGFPMAPSEDEWAAMTSAERDAIVASLPDEVTEAEMSPPEGDQHFNAKVQALDALRGYFRTQGKKLSLAAELPTYYPSEPRFAPDLLAVRDAEDRERGKWVVSAEGKGLDWVMEVHFAGDRKKDAERNVARYARLGIPEYFIYDRAQQQLLAYELATPRATSYTPIAPARGRRPSRVLGLDLAIEDERLRFYAGTALVLESRELHRAARAHARRPVQRRLDDEQRGRAAADAEIARLRAELERRDK